MIVRISNAFRAADTIEFAQAKRIVVEVVLVSVPHDASVGSPAVASLTVADEGGQEAEAYFVVPIEDVHAPEARLDLLGLRADGTIGTGEVVDLRVSATDNYRLRHIGYEGGGVRDSVDASGIADSNTFQLTIPPTWRAPRPVLNAWARDSAGNVSAWSLKSAREIPVYDWADHPVLTVPLIGQAFPFDVAWDAKRSLAYILRNAPNGMGGQVDVWHSPSGALGESIALPSRPDGFALSASGDSLVVLLPDARALGIVDLLQPVPATAVVPLQYDAALNMLPRTAQVATGHVFVTLMHGLYPARLLDVNLTTGVQVIRADMGGTAEVTPRPSLFRLPDGRLLLCPESAFAYSPERFLYSPASDSFTQTFKLRAAGPRQFAASPSGRFMLGNTIYDAALDSIAAVATQDWKEEYGSVAALSADGSAAFLATTYGYEMVRLSDGLLLEQVKLEMTPYLLLPLPDGSGVIAIGGLPGSTTGETATMIVDLR